MPRDGAAVETWPVTAQINHCICPLSFPISVLPQGKRGTSWAEAWFLLLRFRRKIWWRKKRNLQNQLPQLSFTPILSHCHLRKLWTEFTLINPISFQVHKREKKNMPQPHCSSSFPPLSLLPSFWHRAGGAQAQNHLCFSACLHLSLWRER